MGTIVKRTNLRSTSWHVKIRRKGQPQLYKTFRSREEAEAWMHAVEGELDAANVWIAIDAARTKLLPCTDLLQAPFRLLIERYGVEITPSKKSAPQEAPRINALQRSTLATYKIAELTSKIIADWKNERLKIVKPVTALRDLALIQRIIEVARREWGLELDKNPVHLVSKPSAGPGRERRLSATEETMILEAADSSRGGFLRDVIVIGLETAMRQGEIAGLDWKFVNLQERRIHLTVTKNGSTRGVPLSRKASSVLERRPERDGPVFIGVTPEAVKRAFRNACKRAGIVDLHFHDLRHEATSRFFEKGLSMMEVASITGHKSLSMLQRYTHLDAGKLAHRLD